MLHLFSKPSWWSTLYDTIKYNKIATEIVYVSQSICDKFATRICSLNSKCSLKTIAIQRGNAACIIGAAPNSEGFEEIFDYVQDPEYVDQENTV